MCTFNRFSTLIILSRSQNCDNVREIATLKLKKSAWKADFLLSTGFQHFWHFREIATQLSRNCHPTFEKLPPNFREIATLGFPRKPLVDWADGHFQKWVDSVESVESVCPRPHSECGARRAVAASALRGSLEKLPLSKADKRKSWFLSPTFFFAGKFRETATFKFLFIGWIYTWHSMNAWSNIIIILI